jgi:hypothetical protein
LKIFLISMTQEEYVREFKNRLHLSPLNLDNEQTAIKDLELQLKAAVLAQEAAMEPAAALSSASDGQQEPSNTERGQGVDPITS